MKIKIDPTKKLSLIKAEFNEAFPFLRIEFFTHPHKVNAPNSKKDLILKDVPLSELKRSKHIHAIEINDDMPVETVEQMFQKEFGVAMQVFRKSGKSWLETSVTDDWTLRRQNEEGMELSQFSA